MLAGVRASTRFKHLSRPREDYRSRYATPRSVLTLSTVQRRNSTRLSCGLPRHSDQPQVHRAAAWGAFVSTAPDNPGLSLPGTRRGILRMDRSSGIGGGRQGILYHDRIRRGLRTMGAAGGICGPALQSEVALSRDRRGSRTDRLWMAEGAFRAQWSQTPLAYPAPGGVARPAGERPVLYRRACSWSV